MISSESILYFASTYLKIYSVIDCIEILFFTLIVFKVSSWLNKDHTKALLLYFYSYVAILFGSYFFQLTTIYQVMLASAPIFFVLLIVHHQKNLQKNFILSNHKPITPATMNNKQWIEILIRSCLVASHHKKNVTCIIERQNKLNTLIDQPFSLNIMIQKHIIDMLLESVSYNDQKLIWVQQDGTLISVNATWSDLVVNELIFDQVSAHQLPKEYAKVITGKTDAILVHINTQHDHNFVSHQGKIVENLSIDQSLKLIKKLLYKNNIENQLSKGVTSEKSKYLSFQATDKN